MESDFDSLFPEVLQHHANTLLIDGLDGFGGNAQCNPASFFRDIKALLLQVRQPAAFVQIMSVADMITGCWTFAGYDTTARHDYLQSLLRAKPEYRGKPTFSQSIPSLQKSVPVHISKAQQSTVCNN